MSPSGVPRGVKSQSGATGAVDARNVKQLTCGSRYWVQEASAPSAAKANSLAFRDCLESFVRRLSLRSNAKNNESFFGEISKRHKRIMKASRNQGGCDNRCQQALRLCPCRQGW